MTTGDALNIGIGFLALVFGGYMAYVQWVQRWRARLCWSCWPYAGTRLDGEPATTTRIRMWNVGRQRLDWATHAPSDHPRIEVVGDGWIHHAVVTATTKAYTGFRLGRIAADHADVTFDYLEHNDGAVIDIDHTQAARLVFRGAFKGMRPCTYVPVDFVGEEDPREKRRQQERRADILFNFQSLATPLFLLVVFPPGSQHDPLVYILGGFVAISAVMRMWFHRHLSPKVPAKLRLPKLEDLPEAMRKNAG